MIFCISAITPQNVLARRKPAVWQTRSMKAPPMTSDYYPSEFLFAERLRELNPKVVLLLGEHGTYSKDVVRKVFHEEREISRQHPLPMSYKTMEVLEKAWAEVQAKCAYLAVLK